MNSRHENIRNEMKVIGEIITKAEQRGLLIEVIDTAIHVAKSNQKLTTSEIITQSASQWDI